MAETFHSVSFTPHITLSGTPDWSEERIKTAVDSSIQDTSPLVLKTTTIRCSSNPYQKFTHGIEVTKQLSALHQKMDTCFGGDFAKKAYPHISYLYSRLTCEEITPEIDPIQKEAPQTIIANQVALVRCKGTPKEWRTLYKWELKN